MPRISVFIRRRHKRKPADRRTATARKIYNELRQAGRGGRITVDLDYLFADLLEAFGFEPWDDLVLRGRDAESI